MCQCSSTTPAAALTVPAPSREQATGYGLLISVLQRERGDFDGFLRFWRRFLTPKGLMYWQLVRGGDGEVRLRMQTKSSTLVHRSTVPLRPAAHHRFRCFQIKANLGTLNSATDGDMDIAFALLLAAKVTTLCHSALLTPPGADLTFCSPAQAGCNFMLS